MNRAWSRTAGWSLALLASSFLPHATVVAQDEVPAGMQQLRTAEGTETVLVPSSWNVEPHTSLEKSLGRWDVTLPDGVGKAMLLIGKANGLRDEVIGTAKFGRKSGEPGSTASEFFATPVPHATYEFTLPKSGGVVKACDCVRVVRRRGFVLTFWIRKEAFDKALPAFLACVPTFTSSRGEFPDMPDTYQRSLKDGYEYLLHPSVNAQAIEPMHRFLLAQEAAFAKRYGPVRKPADNPILVVIHSNEADALAMQPKASGGCLGDPATGTLYTLPLPKDDPVALGQIAECFAFVLHTQVFGLSMSNWQFGGDGFLANIETCAGKPLPSVAESLYSRVPQSLSSLLDLMTREKLGGAELMELAVYLAFFRSGAKPYADAFAAFVKDVRAGVDPAVAQKRLEQLDQAKLKAAAQAFAATFKPVKGR